MAVNYTFLSDTTNTGGLVSSGWTARFQVGGANGRFLQFVDNGIQSIAVVSSGTNACQVLRFDPETVTGNSLGVTLTVNVPAAPTAAHFYPNGSNSYLFVTAAAITYFWRGINISTMSGTISNTTAAATFDSADNTFNFIDFAVFGSTAYLFARNRFWRFNPETIASTGTAADVTFSPTDVAVGFQRCFFESSTVALAFFANSNSGNTTRGFCFNFNPSTASSTLTTATATFTATGNSATGYGDVVKIGADYHLTLGISSQSIAARPYWIFNSVVSGVTTNTGSFPIDPGQTNDNSRNFMQYIAVSSSIVLLLTQYINAGNFYHIQRLTIPSSVENYLGFRQTLANTTGNYTRIFRAGSKFVRFTHVPGSTNFIQVYVDDLNTRDILLTLAASPALLSSQSAIRKTTTTPLTLFSTLDYFSTSLLLRAGATIPSSGVNNALFNYAFTATDDTAGTLSENFALDGSSVITGDYRITISGADLILGTLSTYNTSFTLTSTARLVLNRNVTITNELILSAGTQVVAANGTGPYLLTIPYANPGLTLGTGITLAAPTVTVTLTSIIPGSEVRIYATGTQTEMAGNEAIAGTTFDFVPAGAFDIRIFRAGYQVFRSINNPVPASSISTQMAQLIDRGYIDAA